MLQALRRRVISSNTERISFVPMIGGGTSTIRGESFAKRFALKLGIKRRITTSIVRDGLRQRKPNMSFDVQNFWNVKQNGETAIAIN